MPNIFKKTTPKLPTLSQLEREDKEAGSYPRRTSAFGTAVATIGGKVVPSLAAINRNDAARSTVASPSGRISGDVSGGVGRQLTPNEIQHS